MIRAMIRAIRRALARRRAVFHRLDLDRMTDRQVSDFLHGRPIDPACLTPIRRRGWL